DADRTQMQYFRATESFGGPAHTASTHWPSARHRIEVRLIHPNGKPQLCHSSLTPYQTISTELAESKSCNPDPEKVGGGKEANAAGSTSNRRSAGPARSSLLR